MRDDQSQLERYQMEVALKFARTLDVIRSNQPSVQSVDLSDANLGNEDVKALIDALAQNRYIKNVNVSENRLSYESVEQLMRSTNVVLSFSGNDMNDAEYTKMTQEMEIRDVGKKQGAVEQSNVDPVVKSIKARSKPRHVPHPTSTKANNTSIQGRT